MSGNVRIGSTVMASPSGKSDRRVLHMQARAAVDLGAARAALGGLAVPAARRGRAGRSPGSSGWRRGRPCPPRWARGTRRSRPRSPGSPRNTHRVASVTIRALPPALRHEQRASSSGSVTVVGPSRTSMSVPSRRTAHVHMVPRVRRVPGGRGGCGRRGSPSRIERRCARRPPTTMSMLRSSNTRSQPGLNGRGPARPAARPARLELVEAGERRLEVRLGPEDADERLHHLPGAPRGAGAGPRRRSARTARRARPRDSATNCVRQARSGGRSPTRRPARRPSPGALPEHEQVRQRVAARAGSRRAGRPRPRRPRTGPARVVAPSRRRRGCRPSCSASSGRPPSGPP